MSSNSFSRRDFLKLAGLSTLSLAGVPRWNPVENFPGLKSDPLPNILILVFDALSARDMSLYGYPRQTTPNMERFARQATVYNRHYAAGNFTTPGTASLLTGVQPWIHRAINLQGQTIDRYAGQNIFSLLPSAYRKFAYTHNTLVQILLDQFRRSIDDLLETSDLAEFTDLLAEQLPLNEFVIPLEAELLSMKNPFSVESSLFLSLADKLRRKLRSQEVYAHNRDLFPRGLPNCREGDPDNALCFKVETAVNWLIEQFSAQAQPFFGYVHLLPPHAPYNPRREFIGLFEGKSPSPKKPEHHFSDGKDAKSLERLRRRYDETIAYADAEFGRLLDFLISSKALENTCLIVTSDHGELIERGISGHNTPVLYEPLLHIPLLISYPHQQNAQVIHAATHAADLLPSLLQLTGVDIPQDLNGEILPRQPEQNPTARDLLISEAKSSPKQGALKRGTFALVRDRYKLIYYRGYSGFDNVFELYDLGNDPEEIEDIYSEQDPLSTDMKASLLKHLEGYL